MIVDTAVVTVRNWLENKRGLVVMINERSVVNRGSFCVSGFLAFGGDRTCQVPHFLQATSFGFNVLSTFSVPAYLHKPCVESSSLMVMVGSCGSNAF